VDLAASYIVSEPDAPVAIARSKVARAAPVPVSYPTAAEPKKVLDTTA